MSSIFQDARNVGHSPRIKPSVRWQYKVCVPGAQPAVYEVSNLQAPFGFLLVPHYILDLALELKVVVNIVTPSKDLPILSNLFSGGKLLRPLRVGSEGRLVHMRWYITTDSGIDVLQPSTTLG